MPIRPLPQAAVRLIGSAQTLTDSASVVKELIDNAIDARATSISIEISSNTLDLIQVRDNGHGIAPDDRAMVAKRYCTSKIKDHHDLSKIGGSYLGFRGEALNSVAEMSGAMTVITRVDGEDMATSMKILPDGELSGEERASHPVGTTVRIANFLDGYPVRKQTGLKGASKALARIKQYLLGYAFAKPALRLSLRVIKAKSDRDNWTYASSVSESIEQASSRIVGRHCASQCARFEYEAKRYKISALLPRIDSDRTKINGIGQYFSVDGRPVSASRGIFKQVVKIFKACLQQSTVPPVDTKDPFVYLDLSCPEGSYDPNIEPAKDDVLFAEIDMVLSIVRDFLDSAYPPAEPVPPQSGPSCMDQYDAGDEPEPVATDETSTSARIPLLVNEYRSSMYDVGEHDLALLSEIAGEAEPSAILEDQIADTGTSNQSWSNPWITAKMNGRTGKTNLGHSVQAQLVTPGREPADIRGVPLSSSPMAVNVAHFARQTASSRGLPTPRASSVICGSDGNDPQVFSDMSDRVHGPLSDREQTSETPGPGSLGAVHMSLPHAQPFDDLRQRLSNSPVQQTVGASGITLDEIPEGGRRGLRTSKQPRQGYHNKPFKPPLAPERDAWFHIPEAETSGANARKARPRQAQRPGLIPQSDPPGSSFPHPLSPPANNRDIRSFITASIAPSRASEVDMFTPINQAIEPSNENTAPEDHHHRPTALNTSFVRASDLAQDHGEEQADQQQPISRPPRRRKTSERTALRAMDINRADRDGDDLDDESYDPKSSSTRRVPSAAKRKRTDDGNSINKPHRTKSSKLPLERVPPDLHIQNLVFQSTTTSIEILSSLWRAADNQNRDPHLPWCSSATDVFEQAFDRLSEEDMDIYAERLEYMLDERSPEGERTQDLAVLVRRALERVSSGVDAGPA